MTITVYHFPPSPPSSVALFAARVVGVDVTVKNIDLFKKEQLSEEFVKINPQHVVPTIDDNGFVLWESNAIATYLARQYSKDDNLYPKNPQLKAVIDQRLYFCSTTLFPRIRAIAFNALFLGERTVSEEKKKAVNDALALLEKFLHGRKWLTGDVVSIADVCTYPFVAAIVAVGFELTAFPGLTAWYEQAHKLPGADEVQAGLKTYGEAVRSKLDPGQVP